MMRRGVLALALTALPAAASAQQAPCASERDRLEDAINRFQENDFEGAERGLTFALRSCPTDASVEGLLGLAQSRTGHLVEAERHLQAALSNARNPWIIENRPVLERRLAELQPQLGSVMVSANVAGATVVLPDERRVLLPMRTPERVLAGEFTLRVIADGYTEASRELRVAPQGVAQTRVELTPAPRAAPTPTLAATRLLVRETSPVRTAGWVTAGVGAALVAAGIVQFARSLGQQSAAASAMPGVNGDYGAWATYRQGFADNVTADTMCDTARAGNPMNASAEVLASARSLCEENATTRLTAWVFTVAGALVAGTGLTMAVLAGERTTEDRLVPRLTARLSPGSQGLSLMVPFQ